jgi:general stress protein 26
MGENSNRAKEIIRNILYITLATTSKEGWPWNSPVYSASDESYTFYWISYKNAQHSKNITENRRVFIVIYNSTVPEGTGVGVYIQAKAYVVTDEEEVQRAVNYLYQRIGGQPPPEKVKELQGDCPRRIYKAVLEKFWINARGEVDGNYIDVREEVVLR